MPVALEEMQAPDTIPFLSLQLNKSMRNYGIDLFLRFLRVAYHVYNDRFQIAENSKMDAAILNLAEQPGRLLVELLYLINFFHDLFQVEIIKH